MKNIAFFASQSRGKGYADGKWRPILFDVYMSSMQRDLVEQDSIQRAREWHPLFDYLFDDEQFREDFYDRLEYLDDEVFDDDIVDEYLDKYCEQMSEPMKKHLKRYYGDRITMDDFYDDIESIREFFDKRELEAD